jgi:hypothetical protein
MTIISRLRKPELPDAEEFYLRPNQKYDHMVANSLWQKCLGYA